MIGRIESWNDDPEEAEFDALSGPDERRYGLRFGGGKKGGGSSRAPQMVSTTSTTKSDPWTGQQPSLTFGFEEARRQYDSPAPQFYPEATYVPMPAQSREALGLMEQRARAGSPITDLGRSEYLDTLGGKYIDQGNPYLTDLKTKFSNILEPDITSRFATGGRAGSGAEAEMYTRSMADALAPYLYGDYATERGRQYDAMTGAPGYAATDYADPARLAGVGEAYRAEDEAALGDAMARWQFEQNVQQQKLNQYIAQVGGNYGGTTETTGQQPWQSPMRPDPWQNILGLGSLGVGIASIPGIWNSSRDIKTPQGDVDTHRYLGAVRDLPISAWSYKLGIAADGAAVHVGPYAEDWQELTGLGDGRTINIIDAIGVLLAAVKELDARVSALASVVEKRDA